jgi:Tfp pilus assembly protein FimT
MRTSPTTFSSGVMLMQVLISIVIIATLSTIVAINLGSFRERQALSNTVDEVIALVNQARSRTLAAEGGSVYGVHFGASEAVLFTGATYVPGTFSNRVLAVNSAIVLDAISLQGGGTDVVFDMLTGDTAQYGTLVVHRVSTAVGQRLLTIAKTGAISSD